MAWLEAAGEPFVRILIEPNEVKQDPSCVQVQADTGELSFFTRMNLTPELVPGGNLLSEVFTSCVEAAFSILTTRGRLLWLYSSLCFMC